MIAMIISVMMVGVVLQEYGIVNDGLVSLCEHNDPLYVICNIQRFRTYQAMHLVESRDTVVFFEWVCAKGYRRVLFEG